MAKNDPNQAINTVNKIQGLSDAISKELKDLEPHALSTEQQQAVAFMEEALILMQRVDIAKLREVFE